jgi:hypothetical protein
VDIVVVYKIDRLTRSLMDFAKMVDVFDGQGVSFVSVTQAFNTTTSMGRLTLNVLLSFAQFEREVTAERIRDKIAASKKKGMWMGGPTPLGYDVRDKRLVVNEAEAEQVKRIFDLYRISGSVRQLKQILDDEGIVTKRRRLRDGRVYGGKPFMRGNLYQLLANPIYIGKVGYKGEVYPGLHAPIVDPEVWGAVQALRSTRAPNRGSPCNTISPSLLVGLIYDESGDRLSPSHAVKAGVRYRYYISRRLMLSPKNASGGWRLPARELEDQVLGAVCGILEDDLKLANLLSLRGVSPSALRATAAAARRLGQDLLTAHPIDRKNLLQQFVHRIEMHPDRLALSIDQTKLVRRIGGNQVGLLHLASTEAAETSDEASGALAINSANHIVTIDLSHQMKRRGVEAKIILGESGSRAPHHDQGLIALIANAHRWLDALTKGKVSSITDLAAREHIDRNEVSRFLSLAFLAPDIVESILDGIQPVDLTIKKLRRVMSLPYAWEDQRSLLGFAK